jgi:hypothetical protein
MSRRKKFKLGKRHARCYAKTQATQRANAVTTAINARKWYLGRAIRGLIQFIHDRATAWYTKKQSSKARFLAGLTGAFLVGGEAKQ